MSLPEQTYRRGVVLVVLAGVFLSTGGLLIRFIQDANVWTVLFYRSLTFFTTVCLFLYWRDGSQFVERFKSLKPLDALVSFSLAIGFISYVLSLFNTSVANTVLILSTGPVIAALIAWLVLRERVGKITLLAMVAAFLGVGVMMSDGIAGGDVAGLLYALLAVLSFSVMVVSLRKAANDRDMLAPTALAGLLAALLSVPFMPGLQISFHDLLCSMALGSLQIGCGFILITLGSRTVPAAQIPLLALAETALSPLWVWLFVNEVPASKTLIGGGIILVAVLSQSVAGAFTRR
ncbi:MAG: DMT family transporter [Granulosicoccus sp.]